MIKTTTIFLLLSCTAFVAQAVVVDAGVVDENVCKPAYFDCPDGYQLDLDICGCVKIHGAKQCAPGAANKCSWNQVFVESICACVCKDDGHCQGKQIFNPDQCICECPAEAADHCGKGQILDPKSCECVCPVVKKCNRLQKFNEDTCECECQKVIVSGRRRRPICNNKGSSSSSKSGSSDSGSDSDSDSDSSNGCSEGSDSSDSSDSSKSSNGGNYRHYNNYRYYNNHKGGSRSKRSDSSNGGSHSDDSSSGGRKRNPLRPFIANECPRGQKANSRTCRCSRRRYY